MKIALSPETVEMLKARDPNQMDLFGGPRDVEVKGHTRKVGGKPVQVKVSKRHVEGHAKPNEMASAGKMQGGLGLHVTKFPSGRYGFMGSVPHELAHERKDGQPLTEEDKEGIRQAGPGFLPHVRTRTWDSHEDAVAAAKQHEKEHMASSAEPRLAVSGRTKEQARTALAAGTKGDEARQWVQEHAHAKKLHDENMHPDNAMSARVHARSAARAHREAAELWGKVGDNPKMQAHHQAEHEKYAKLGDLEAHEKKEADFQAEKKKRDERYGENTERVNEARAKEGKAKAKAEMERHYKAGNEGDREYRARRHDTPDAPTGKNEHQEAQNHHGNYAAHHRHMQAKAEGIAASYRAAHKHAQDAGEHYPGLPNMAAHADSQAKAHGLAASAHGQAIQHHKAVEAGDHAKAKELADSAGSAFGDASEEFRKLDDDKSHSRMWDRQHDMSDASYRSASHSAEAKKTEAKFNEMMDASQKRLDASKPAPKGRKLRMVKSLAERLGIA